MNTIHSLSLSLYSSSRLLVQLISSKLSEIGLTYPQYLVLSCLWEEDGLRVNQIGKKLLLDSGTLTPLLKKLESLNYVKRVRGEEDERTVTAELTYPGKSLQQKAESAMNELEEALQESSAKTFQEVNQTIHDLLEELQLFKNQ
ncbi:MarR family winged helix-turn-helix transcriptional regulator [Algoriphagus sediminis]|uniref:MarR family transcriptional regulator n=1 Tax=Algoriphagus sediminis TaxID=3057113 RepID=A0ABT7YBU3_9BACT|nr:MarR family transcriptional regulator [Algoriphagus sediminis]MDN3203989.1 MarR family transcriptional regulator [Algoriphagus sediminis]